MPRYQDIEVVDIDDPPVSVLDSGKKRERFVRKSTGLGGKSPRVSIASKPLRRNQSLSKKRIECFDIDSDDDDEEGDTSKGQNSNSDSDDDDDIEVLEDEDPLEEGESVEDETGGFCDLCGLYQESQTEIVKHQYNVHKLSYCNWCKIRTLTSELKIHIQSSCAKFVKLRGTHCSIHNRIEKEEDLQVEGSKNCRPLRCDTCLQRFEITSLLQKDPSSQLYICPGCIHGRVDPTKPFVQSEDSVDKSKEPSDEIHLEEEDVEVNNPETFVGEILDELLSSLMIKESQMEFEKLESTNIGSSENMIILHTEDGTQIQDKSEETSEVEKDSEPVTKIPSPSPNGGVRRVARKSTRPPQNPQRPMELSEIEEVSNMTEVSNMAEVAEVADLSSKRKPEQYEEVKQPRKVARKSTRPPPNLQKEKEPEIVELDDDDDEEIVELPARTTDLVSLLLDSPSHRPYQAQACHELEEMVLS